MDFGFKDYLPLYVGNFCWWWLPNFHEKPRNEPLSHEVLAHYYASENMIIKLQLRPLSCQDQSDVFSLLQYNTGQRVAEVYDFTGNAGRIGYRTQSAPTGRKSKLKFNLFPIIPVTLDAHIYCARKGIDSMLLLQTENAFQNTTDFQTWFHMEHKKQKL